MHPAVVIEHEQFRVKIYEGSLVKDTIDAVVSHYDGRALGASHDFTPEAAYNAFRGKPTQFDNLS